jgi:hypothetical protein
MKQGASACMRVSSLVLLLFIVNGSPDAHALPSSLGVIVGYPARNGGPPLDPPAPGDQGKGMLSIAGRRGSNRVNECNRDISTVSQR